MDSSSIRRILCPVDFSATSAKALRYAAALAFESGAELIVLHAYLFRSPPYFTGGHSQGRAVELGGWQAVAESNLKDFVAKAAGRLTPRIERVVVQGLATSAIALSVETFRPDLIVMGKQGRINGGLTALGSVTERALRTTVTPMLIVPPGHDEAGDGVVVREIVCPVENTAPAGDSLRVAAMVAAGYRAPLILLHVREEPSRSPCSLVSPQMAVPCQERDFADVTEMAEKVLALASASHHGVLVIGAWHQHIRGRTILGRTTTAIVRDAECPVLVVPPIPAPKSLGQPRARAAA